MKQLIIILVCCCWLNLYYIVLYNCSKLRGSPTTILAFFAAAFVSGIVTSKQLIRYIQDNTIVNICANMILIVCVIPTVMDFSD